MAVEKPIVRTPGEGRTYELGDVRGVFKADELETADRFCASEWSVAPGGSGPGADHHDENVEVFLVTEGTMSFLVGDEWMDAPTGTYLQVPAGVTHDFANRTDAPASAFNVFIPGGFEAPFREWYETDGPG